MTRLWERRVHKLIYHLVKVISDPGTRVKYHCGRELNDLPAHSLPENKRQNFVAQAKSENWKHQPTFCKRCLKALERGKDA
jgi:hypothetical protein